MKLHYFQERQIRHHAARLTPKNIAAMMGLPVEDVRKVVNRLRAKQRRDWEKQHA